MRDKLPLKIKTRENGIINLDNNSGKGTHWTAYKKFKSKVIYFDSFGNLRPPMEVMRYFHSNGNIEILYNYNIYQTYNSIQCGHLCLRFLLSK